MIQGGVKLKLTRHRLSIGSAARLLKKAKKEKKREEKGEGWDNSKQTKMCKTAQKQKRTKGFFFTKQQLKKKEKLGKNKKKTQAVGFCRQCGFKLINIQIYIDIDSVYVYKCLKVVALMFQILHSQCFLHAHAHTQTSNRPPGDKKTNKQKTEV